MTLSHGNFFLSAAEEKELPLPRDHRIVLVEDATGILIRISLNAHKIRDVEVRLIIGVGVSLWSSLADYPGRVPLYHCDALLHYTAAQSVSLFVCLFIYLAKFMFMLYVWLKDVQRVNIIHHVHAIHVTFAGVII